MTFKEVTDITSNEDHVRLRIYNGDLQVSEAAQELIRLERSQAEEYRRKWMAEVKRGVQAETDSW